MGVSMPSVEAAKALYQQPALEVDASGVPRPPPKSAWHSRNAHQDPKMRWSKLSAAVKLKGTLSPKHRPAASDGVAATAAMQPGEQPGDPDQGVHPSAPPSPPIVPGLSTESVVPRAKTPSDEGVEA